MGWKLGATLALLMAVAGAMAVYFTLFNAPVAADDGVSAEEAHGRPVPGKPGLSEWVFVFPAPNGDHPGKGARSASTYDKCNDGDQTAYTLFAKANLGGLAFNINPSSGRPSNITENAWVQAVNDSFAAWDGVDLNTTYFAVNPSGGAARPALDANNTVGWAFIVPKTTLAAAWVWTDDATGRVTEADIFFNTSHPWDVYGACNGNASAFEVGNVGTHEVAHVIAMNHVKDEFGHATTYPSAPKGEVKKRTLTAGDVSGFAASLAP